MVAFCKQIKYLLAVRVHLFQHFFEDCLGYFVFSSVHHLFYYQRVQFSLHFKTNAAVQTYSFALLRPFLWLEIDIWQESVQHMMYRGGRLSEICTGCRPIYFEHERSWKGHYSNRLLKNVLQFSIFFLRMRLTFEGTRSADKSMFRYSSWNDWII